MVASFRSPIASRSKFKRLLPSLYIGLASMLALASPAAAQDLTPAETARIDALANAALAKTGTPAASVAVVRGGRLVFAKLYGKASETIATADTRLPFQIASNSKQFTAAAVLLLADDGKLSLDDHVAKYFPEISGGDTITIRQLLSHTAGLQDYWPQDYSFKAMATPVSPQGIVDRWARKPLDFVPGTQWQYSNTGYVVAGLIVEKVAGEPLLTFLQRRIFRPLGMTAIDQDLAIGKAYPQGYGRAALGPVRAVTPPARGWLYAAGELSMSASDLAKWDVARLNRSLLPAADWAVQETPVKLADGSATGYGLGVAIGTRNGRRIVEHSGEAVGFLSENIVYPDDKAAIVVLTNSWSGDAFTAIANGIAEVVLPAPRQGGDDAKTIESAKAILGQLTAGTLDRAMLTEDANYYFTAVTLADYRTSLASLGTPTSFTAAGKPRLRGGFVNRNYHVSYGEKQFDLSTYLEPGDAGRYEQFLLSPVN